MCIYIYAHLVHCLAIAVAMVKLDGFACAATYCQARINKENPGVDVPKESKRREEILLKIWQSYESDKSKEVLDRVDKEINRDKPRRIRFCINHLPPDSIEISEKGYRKIRYGVVPFGLKEHRKWIAEQNQQSQKRELESIGDLNLDLDDLDSRTAKLKKRKIAATSKEELISQIDSHAKHISSLEEQIRILNKQNEDLRQEHLKISDELNAVKESIDVKAEDLFTQWKERSRLEPGNVRALTFDLVCVCCVHCVYNCCCLVLNIVCFKCIYRLQAMTN